MLADILLSLLIMVGASFLMMGTAYFFVRNDFFLPHFVRAGAALGLPTGRAFVALVFTLEILSVSGLLGWVAYRLGHPGAPDREVTDPAVNAPGFGDVLGSLGPIGVAVLAILLIMSMYSIAVMVERFLTYRAAKRQSREFGPRVAQALKNNRIDEAIEIADKHKKSHLAMVVNAGLHEFRAQEQSGELSGEEIAASKRALQQAIAIKSAEFRRGLSGLATIGSAAPFVGLFGTVFGIIAAFAGMKDAEAGGVGAVAGGLAEALMTTALGLAVAVPAVWMFNYFTGKVDGFIAEMDKSASELINYFKDRAAAEKSNRVRG